uniref:Uncharacterized protein n=1 Tax=Anopheles minimus TaxID=112268 RepID=A0A182VYB1_9DIPT
MPFDQTLSHESMPFAPIAPSEGYRLRNGSCMPCKPSLLCRGTALPSCNDAPIASNAGQFSGCKWVGKIASVLAKQSSYVDIFWGLALNRPRYAHGHSSKHFSPIAHQFSFQSRRVK